MKILRFLCLALPLCFLAASSNPQACGPVRFGMQGAELQNASKQLRLSAHGTITAATLRQGLVADGVKYAALLKDRDATLPLQMRYTVGHPLAELTFQSHEFHPAAEYDSQVRSAWEILQDVAASKIAPTTSKGAFPPIGAIDKGGKIFVTDTLEANGIRIEVGVVAATFYGTPELKYSAVLKVSDKTTAVPQN